MADRSWRAIEDISVGELVLAWDRSGRIWPARVEAVHTIDAEEGLHLDFDNDSFDVTDHPFAPTMESRRLVSQMDAGETMMEYHRGVWGTSTVQVKPETVEYDRPTRHRTLTVRGWASYFVRGGSDRPAKAVYNKPNNT